MQSMIQCPKNPSAFARSGLLPQIMKRSGRRYSGWSKRASLSCPQSAMNVSPRTAFMPCMRGV